MNVKFTEKLLNHWFQLLMGLGLIFLILLAGRASLYWDNFEAVSANLPAGEWMMFFKHVFLYDFRIVSIIGLVLMAFSLLPRAWFNRISFSVLSLVAVVSIGLSIGNFYFFREYHSQFNEWVYGLYYDDTEAILETMWDAYPISLVVIIFILANTAVIWAIKRVFSKQHTTAFSSKAFRITTLVVILLSFGIGARGSLTSRPLAVTDASVTSHAELNKLTMNPYWALYYTYRKHSRMQQAQGVEKFWTEDIDLAVAEYFEDSDASTADIERLSTQQARGLLSGDKPKHIFLFVVESLDSWPFLDEYTHLGLVDSLRSMTKRGVHADRFVSAGTSTRTSMNAILTGLPDAYVYTHFQPRSQKPYITSISEPFKQLGYTTQLFYGGYLRWQNVGEMAAWQGIDRSYGREHMPVGTAGNAWGVHDEALLRFVAKTVKESDQPTFNIVLTTSNHSPYSIDVESMEAPLPEGGATKGRILAHQWYSDYCLSHFIDNMNAHGDRVLYGITGDHCSRRYYTHQPTLYDEKSVPFIVIDSQQDLSNFTVSNGSHIDMAPTLLDLVAPKGFEFHSLGSSLLDQNPQRWGLGADVVVDANTVIPVDLESEDSREQAMRRKYNALHAIAWWMIMRS